MNKRESAIWKLVVFLGLFILAINIFSAIDSNKTLSLSINGDKCNVEQGSGCGIINYFNEFAKYSGSLIEEDVKMINIIESYGVNSDEILSQSKKIGPNESTIMHKANFIEIYSAAGKSRSKVYGFSVVEEEHDTLIIVGKEHFLTEIKGTTKETCPTKEPELKNVLFKNDEIEVGANLNFQQFNQEIECPDGRLVDENNALYLTNDGQVWYNSTSNINSFEFKVEGAKILNILSGVDPNVFDNFIILSTDNSIIGFSKTNFSIPGGCGMLLKLDLDQDSFTLSDIKISNSGHFYDLNVLNKYNAYNDSILNHINYFYSKLNSDNNVEVYIKTDDEIDEYSFDISCFTCDIIENTKILSELEILRAKTKKRDFYFSMSTNDPSDLTNIIMFDGEYNQGKQQRAVVPTAMIEGKNPTGLAEYQNRTHTIALGDTIGDFKIIEMNQKYFLGENIKINKVDTLKMQGEE